MTEAKREKFYVDEKITANKLITNIVRKYALNHPLAGRVVGHVRYGWQESTEK